MAKKSSTTDTVVRRFEQMLPVRLVSDELRERGEMLAHSRQLAEQHALDAADIKTRLKKQAEKLEMEITRLATIIREKQEPRPVTVEVRLTKRTGQVEEVRLDTGEVVATRRMRDDETQVDMLEMPYDAVPRPGELEV